MSIWRQWFGAIRGGWKTHGPNSIAGNGAWASDDADGIPTVDSSGALKLGAVWACMNLRSEVIGSLPFKMYDRNRKIITDDPLADVLHWSPNSMMTAAEFWSLCTAHLDMFGNFICIVERRIRDKTIISLEPVDPSTVSMHHNGTEWEYKIGALTYSVDRIFHVRGFGMDGQWGLARLDMGRQILAGQIEANDSAFQTFKQSLKIGGFFEMVNKLDPTQRNELEARLNFYGSKENAGKWMTLLPGMRPIAGEPFRVKPKDAQLIESRHFGIEEICRLFNCPPQLIGHSDKASSWASSLEHINLFFLMYSLQPTFVRIEQRVMKSLLRPSDRADGRYVRFNIQSLLRSDAKTQASVFATGLQNGYYNRNEVRELLERANIPGGDEYTIQLNMGQIGANNEKPEE